MRDGGAWDTAQKLLQAEKAKKKQDEVDAKLKGDKKTRT